MARTLPAAARGRAVRLRGWAAVQELRAQVAARAAVMRVCCQALSWEGR
ncbi:hypothetical protein [Streptomyces sp. NPDC050355]